MLLRYLGYLAGRVNAFGGDAAGITPSPRGLPSGPDHGPGGEACDPHGPGELAELTGKVSDVLYDCFGTFEGFVLKTCSSSHSFVSCEKGVAALVMRACREQLTLSVFVARAGTHRIRKVVVRCC